MLQLMAGYQSCPVVYETPRRQPFVTRRFRGFLGAVRLLMRVYQNKTFIRAEQAYNEAVRAHSIGRFDEAEAYYAQCLMSFPDHEPARNNLAALYVERNNPDLAIEELIKARLARPDHFRPYYNLGLIYQMVGRWKDAVEMMEQSIQFQPDHFWSHLALGELFANREDYPTAIGHYQQALQHTERPHAVYVRLAELEVNLRHFEAAERFLEKAMEIQSLPEIHYNLGWLLATMGRRPDDMVDRFATAERGRPEFEQALFNLALAQSLNGRSEASVTSMDRYVAAYVKKPGVETVQYYELLREVNPQNHPALLRIAELYNAQNRNQEAIDVLKELIRSKPSYTDAVILLADTYRGIGRYKDSIQAYRELIKYEPNNVEGYLGLAKSFGAIGNFAAALPVIKKILELAPNHTDLHYQYATLMAEQGKFSIAYKHYRIVANLDPNFPRIKKRLKMLEEEMEEASARESGIWPVVDRPE